jgi:hypothetical protein
MYCRGGKLFKIAFLIHALRHVGGERASVAGGTASPRHLCEERKRRSNPVRIHGSPPEVYPSSYICTGNKKGVNLRDKIKKELNDKLKKTGSIQQKKGKEQD